MDQQEHEKDMPGSDRHRSGLGPQRRQDERARHHQAADAAMRVRRNMFDTQPFLDFMVNVRERQDTRWPVGSVSREQAKKVLKKS
ncbi:MAG: hypothetical protein OXF73_12665 [Gammaproteobacteria bacterium]|nr:hypothetical protein [Gammaproteobacteria bacterium]